MKKLLHFILFSLIFNAYVSAQNEIRLHISPRLASAVFAIDSAFMHPGGAYPVKYTRFEYYVSGIIITHDGGQVTPLTGLHLLVRPVQDSVYSLGQMPDVNKVEAITFSVGVAPEYNHLDPTTWSPDNPLAPQNPEMHWGWVSGYRFAAIEGEAGPNLDQHFEIHSIGDANYFTQTIATVAVQADPDTKVIHLNADYSLAVKDIGLSLGLVKHGTTGTAVTLLANFRDVIFTALVASHVVDPVFEGSFGLLANPVSSSESPELRFSLPSGHNFSVKLTDIAGKEIVNHQLESGESQALTLDILPVAGLYLASLYQDNRLVATEKLVVIR